MGVQSTQLFLITPEGLLGNISLAIFLISAYNGYTMKLPKDIKVRKLWLRNPVTLIRKAGRFITGHGQSRRQEMRDQEDEDKYNAKEAKMKRQLIVTVTQDGKMEISGSTFTVGEIEAIGNQIIRTVQSQQVSFQGAEDEGQCEDKKSEEQPLPPV